MTTSSEYTTIKAAWIMSDATSSRHVLINAARECRAYFGGDAAALVAAEIFEALASLDDVALVAKLDEVCS